MQDLNDLVFFVAVVKYNGFSSASRATGIGKTRLSRRIAELERQLGVSLLQRSTRSISLTEAGERFYERCQATVEEAEAAYECIANLRKEPVGTVRMSCPRVLAQTYLAPILPGYMAAHPKVNLVIEATDRDVSFTEERFDLALCARPQIESMTGNVVKNLGSARRILVASSSYLRRRGTPGTPEDLPKFDTLGRSADLHGGLVRWGLVNRDGISIRVNHSPKLVSNDLRLQFETATNGIGIALLPEPIVAATIESKVLEHVLPEWSAAENLIYLAYPRPRGILPSVRSVIDYLMNHLPAGIQERSMIADAFRAPC